MQHCNRFFRAGNLTYPGRSSHDLRLIDSGLHGVPARRLGVIIGIDSTAKVTLTAVPLPPCSPHSLLLL
ncbi:hypothetical protein VP01_1765g5 [Puccinia sorghi]|uniref:Uncharacterized protein n=1 Tax=Puccinia sorghi TaxID=27349 RepID=A0A0L6VEY8_9BASI|nr:hypothetical protein VP01_1765g5 [Puccinia sorghi]